MSNAASSISLLMPLKAIGGQLAVDDFGAGCSSLSYLKQFPIDTLISPSCATLHRNGRMP
jgi:EAL domain-containing protein (putative c-di-GMP-specific phosphodiesterase class I)